MNDDGHAPATRGDMHGMRDMLRGELHGVRDELRGELRGVRDELRGELCGVRDGLRGELRGVRDELRGELRGVRDELSARLDAHDIRFDGIDGNLRRLNLGFARMEGDVTELKDKTGMLAIELPKLTATVERMNGNIEAALRKMDLQGSMLMDHEGRLKKLEQ